MNINDNTIFEKCQFELEKKFAPKKEVSLKLSESYKRLEKNNKSLRVKDCGSFLEFAHEINQCGEVSEKGKLYNANFCRDRLCPMCSWRKSYKIFAQVSQIMDFIGKDYKFLFLTLTVVNCNASELSETISKLQRAWDKLTKRKRFKVVVKGFFKVLEITRNNKTGEYHPHFHCVLSVAKSYGANKDYIPRDEWLELWRDCYGDSRITQVDIRVARDKKATLYQENLTSVVAEIAKYSVKSSDYIITDDEVLTDIIVNTLSVALSYRRLCSFGGCFKDAHKALNLDDCETGDLIHLDDDKINLELSMMILRYGWSCGAYKLVTGYIK